MMVLCSDTFSEYGAEEEEEEEDEHDDGDEDDDDDDDEDDEDDENGDVEYGRVQQASAGSVVRGAVQTRKRRLHVGHGLLGSLLVTPGL